jgi:hypothetical protein
MPQMMEDVEDKVVKYIFAKIPSRTERSPAESILPAVAYDPPGGAFITTCLPTRVMRKAGCVCKKWRDGFKKYLTTHMSSVSTQVCQRAIEGGLDLCDCDSYENDWSARMFSTSAHSLFLREQQIFVVRCTRRSIEGVHELLTQYEVSHVPPTPGMYTMAPLRTAVIPAVCWIPAASINEEQLAEFRQWRAGQVAELETWIAEQ